MNEITYALRTLRRSPSFTLTAVLTLALGIAVNTVAFTLLNSLALRPMPVRDPEHVVKIFPIDPKGHRQNLFSYQDFLNFQRDAHGFEGMAAYIPTSVTVQAGRADAEDLVAYAVTPEYFPLLGIQPSLGRPFAAADEEQASAVAIISHRLWERRFGSDAGVVGNSIDINGRLFTIIGVGPVRFAGTEPLAPDVWVPTATQPTVIPGPALLADRTRPWLLVVGRLRPGVARDAAAAELTVTARRLLLAYPTATREVDVTVVRGTLFTIDPPLWPIIFLALSVVAMVLAIACANVANLVLARATVQQREVAIRLAIGASRWRVARQLIAETLLLSIAGGAVGLLITSWVLAALYPLGMSLLPFEWGSVVLDVSPDLRVFAYTFGIAAAAGILLGLIPAIQTSSPQISSALHDNAVLVGARMTRARLRDGLVVLQVAMCLALLTAAGLLGRALQRAHALDLGFDVNHAVFTEYDLRRGGYTPTAATEFNGSLLHAVAGGDVAALTSHVPLHGGVVRAAIQPEGLGDAVICTRTNVSASYFRVLGIAVTAGRSFSETEASQRSPLAVISEGLAARFWPRTNPLGRRLTVEGLAVPLTVIGTVRDTSNSSLWREKEMAVYIPAGYADARDLHVIARTDGDVGVLANALRARARSLDARITFRATSLETLLQLWILPSRVASVAAAVLGVLALALASVGLYGVLGYTVAHRTREIGIRIALGATRADVMRLILGSGARLVGLGAAAGIVAAVALGALLRQFLFDLGALDPVTFVLVPLLLWIVSLLACYFPARRASRIEPLGALRAE